MTDNRTTELQSLSKLKNAGRLRYWHGTIEIPEDELHAICDEIQAEHEQAIAATLGSEQPPVDKLIRCLENDYGITASWDGLRKVWLIERATLGSGTCEQVLTDCDDGLMPPFTAHCSACGAEWGFTPNYCHDCGAMVTGTRDERKAVGE